MSLRTPSPSPFVSATEASPQEGKPVQQTVSKANDEVKVKDVKNPEIIVEEDVQSRQQNSSFGKAESSVSSVSVLCSPCLSVSKEQVGSQQSSPQQCLLQNLRNKTKNSFASLSPLNQTNRPF